MTFTKYFLKCHLIFVLITFALIIFQDTQSIHRESSSENVRGRRPNADIMSRVEQEVSRVRGAQEKWKGTVVEQRRNIYDRHTMLN